jgi:GAF domain-containing protein
MDEALLRELAEAERALPASELLARPGVGGLADLFKRSNAELCVPIMSKAKVVGVLMLGPKPGGMPFTEANLEFLVTLGNFAAVAIENAKLYESLDRKVRDLSSLYNISREINRSNDMETVLDLMLETITTGFGVERCSVALFDELKGIFHVERCVGIDEPSAQKYLETILGQSDPLGTGEAVKIAPAPGADTGDILFSVPLIAGNRRIGLLNIFRFRPGIPFTEEYQQIFSIVASQMAPPLVLSQYLSARNLYHENPFDFVYNAVNTMVVSSQAGAVGFTACRLRIAAGGTYANVKELMRSVRPVLQETDVMLHSSFTEIVLLFPATGKEEVKELLDNVIASLIGPKVEERLVSFPDEADNAEKLLSVLYA